MVRNSGRNTFKEVKIGIGSTKANKWGIIEAEKVISQALKGTEAVKETSDCIEVEENWIISS